MTLFPIVGRELAIASRRRSTFWARSGAALAALLALSGLLLFAAAIPASQQGRILFQILSGGAFLYCLLAGARMTADCVSEEKREGTLKLLFLTDLKGYDVVFGKLASSSLGVLYHLLAVIPVMGMALVLGGVTFMEVGRMALVLATTLLFSLAAGMFISVLSKDDRKAMMSAFFLVGIAAGGPIALSVYLAQKFNTMGAGPFGLESTIIIFSPIFPFIATQGPIGMVSPAEFVQSLLLVNGMSAALLALSSYLAPRVGQDGVKFNWLQPLADLQRRIIYGAGQKRVLQRQRLLDQNAFYWLASRNQFKRKNVWILILGLSATWLVSGWRHPEMAFTTGMLIVGACFLVLKIWVAAEVSMRMVEDRRAGALELLLSTPLDEETIAHGQFLALLRQFAAPLLVVFALGGVALWIGLHPAPGGESLTEAMGVVSLFAGMRPAQMEPFQIALVVAGSMLLLIVDLLALRWAAMWLSQSSNSVGRTVRGCVARVLVLPWLAYWVFSGLMQYYPYLLGFGMAEWTDTSKAKAWFAIGLLNSLFWLAYCRSKFLRQFRTLAARRFDQKPGQPPPSASKEAQAAKPAQVRPAFRPSVLLLAVGAVLGTLMIAGGWLAWNRWTLRSQIRAALENIRAAGQPASAAEFLKTQPALSPDHNAANKIMTAAARIILSVEPPRRPGMEPDYQAWRERTVATNAAALALLHEAASLPESRFPERPGMALHRDFTTSCQLLIHEAETHLEREAPDRAAQSLHTLLVLLRFAGSQPQAGLPFQQRAQNMREGLELLSRMGGKMSREQISVLDRDLALLDDDKCFQEMMVAGRAAAIELIDDGPAAILARRAIPVSTFHGLMLGLEDRAQQLSGQRDRLVLRFLEESSAQMDVARILPLHERWKSAQANPGGRIVVPAQFWLAGGSNPFMQFNAHLNEHLQVIAAARLGRCALAAERYRLEKGSLPASLADFQPGPADDSRRNPFTGESLGYEQTGPDYIVFYLQEGVPPELAAAERALRGTAIVRLGHRRVLQGSFLSPSLRMREMAP